MHGPAAITDHRNIRCINGQSFAARAAIISRARRPVVASHRSSLKILHAPGLELLSFAIQPSFRHFSTGEVGSSVLNTGQEPAVHTNKLHRAWREYRGRFDVMLTSERVVLNHSMARRTALFRQHGALVNRSGGLRLPGWPEREGGKPAVISRVARRVAGRPCTRNPGAGISLLRNRNQKSTQPLPARARWLPGQPAGL
jgi:hypothetical protein